MTDVTRDLCKSCLISQSSIMNCECDMKNVGVWLTGGLHMKLTSPIFHDLP